MDMRGTKRTKGEGIRFMLIIASYVFFFLPQGPSYFSFLIGTLLTYLTIFKSSIDEWLENPRGVKKKKNEWTTSILPFMIYYFSTNQRLPFFFFVDYIPVRNYLNTYWNRNDAACDFKDRRVQNSRFTLNIIFFFLCCPYTRERVSISRMTVKHTHTNKKIIIKKKVIKGKKK